MKKLIASRKLQRTCVYCNKEISKGEVYYKIRQVFTEDNKVYANEHLMCPKCKNEYETHKERFQQFQEKCDHPREFIETSYRYIPGECVQEPNYDYCRLCGNTIN